MWLTVDNTFPFAVAVSFANRNKMFPCLICFSLYSSWWPSSILMGIWLWRNLGLPYCYLHFTSTTDLWSWVRRNLLQRTSSWRRGGGRSLICDYQIQTLSGDLCSNTLISKLKKPTIIIFPDIRCNSFCIKICNTHILI